MAIFLNGWYLEEMVECHQKVFADACYSFPSSAKLKVCLVQPNAKFALFDSRESLS